MDTSLTQQQEWSFGDRVVHLAKPEWGAGVVAAAASAMHEGRPCQSLTIRFERAGLKTISTAFARLVAAESVPHLLAAEPEPAEPSANGDGKGNGKNAEKNLLDGDLPFVARDPREVMCRLPDATTDPFATSESRLKATLDLYRFTPTGASLLDWAAAQSGLADPMSRFNRHELERFFEAFVVVRDNHLKKLALDMKKSDPAGLSRWLSQAPPTAQQALRRLDAWR
jgi:hypothetical protein